MRHINTLCFGLVVAPLVFGQGTMPAYIQSPSIETSNFIIDAGEIPAWVIPRTARFVGGIPADAGAVVARPALPVVIVPPMARAPQALVQVPAATPQGHYFAPSNLTVQSIDASKAQTSLQWSELIRSMRNSADELQTQATEAISAAERQRKLSIVKEQLNAIADLERAQKTLDSTQKQMAEILQPAFRSPPADRPVMRPQSFPHDIPAQSSGARLSPAVDSIVKYEIDQLRVEIDDLKKGRIAQEAQLQQERAKQAKLQSDTEELSRQRSLQTFKSQVAELQATENTAKTSLQQTLKVLQDTQSRVAQELEQGSIAERNASASRKQQEMLQKAQRDEASLATAELQRLSQLRVAASRELELQNAKRDAAEKAARDRTAALEIQESKLSQAQVSLQRLQSDREAIASQIAVDAARQIREKQLADEQSERATRAQADLDKIKSDALTASQQLAENQAKAKALLAQQDEVLTGLQLAKAEAKTYADRNQQDSLRTVSVSANSANSSSMVQANSSSTGFVMLPADRLVSTTLARWAAQDNFSLFWSAPDVPAPSQEWELAGANTPHEAIDMAIAALGSSGIKLKVCEHSNRTLTVIKPDQSCSQKQ